MTFGGLTAEQIELRRQGVGGSDAGRIMKGDWLSLFLEKTWRAEPEDLSGNLAVQMGSATEAFNAHWFTKVTGRSILRRGERVQCSARPWMVANLDGVTTTSKGAAAYWDAKHVGVLNEATVLRYTPQMVHCATILRLDWWVLSVFVGNSKHEIVEQEVDPFYAEELIAKEREFWGFVERDEEPLDLVPAVAAPKPAPKLRTIQLEDQWRDDWPNWGGDMLKLFGTYADTHSAYTRHNITREKIKKLLPEDVGIVTRGKIKVARDKAGSVRMSMGKDDG